MGLETLFCSLADKKRQRHRTPAGWILSLITAGAVEYRLFVDSLANKRCRFFHHLAQLDEKRANKGH